MNGPAPPQRLFISGHSLLDQPLPSTLEAIAASLRTPLQWNRQYRVGSSIRDRSRGAGTPRNQIVWQGYREGLNRSGEGMDVIQEWHAPATVTGGLYDTLLITEQHNLLGTLWWSDTVRHLRHYHDRFVAANPAARTWFYEPWLGINDKAAPADWFAYERAASPIWQGLLQRINISLAAEGRPDRIEALPAGLALVQLIERATQGPAVPGVSAGTVRSTIDRLVADDVHLTPLGVYYISLVTYAYLFDRPPVGAWAPDDVDTQTAGSLQALAWEAVCVERTTRRSLTLEQCRAAMQGRFNLRYWHYTSGSAGTPPRGRLGACKDSVVGSMRTFLRMRTGAAENPLRYSPPSDKEFWLPPP